MRDVVYITIGGRAVSRKQKWQADVSELQES